MKEILIETNNKVSEEYKSDNINEESVPNFFFFFRFLKLLKDAKKRKINFEDIKLVNKNKDIFSIVSDSNNIYLNNHSTILNFLIEKNKSKICFIIFLNILRIILMLLNPFLFKQFSRTDINYFYLIIALLIIDFFRTLISLKIELNSNELCLSIDNQIKQIIIKNDLLNTNNQKTKNEKLSTCYTIFNNDIETIKQFFYLFPNFFCIPLLFFSYYFVLFLLFGFTSLVSFLLLIIIIFINIHLQAKLKLGQKNKQIAIDERMKYMTNLIYNLKNIKILLYEKFFYNKIIEKRNQELIQYKILYQTANKIRSLLWASPTFLILLTIICHILFCYYNHIKIKVDSLLIIFGLIDSFQQPILTFCQTYSSYLISKVSAKRIEKYLVTKNPDKNEKNEFNNSLNINIDKLNIGKNEIVFIIGDTGSGKSFLLKHIYNKYKNNNKIDNKCLIYNGQESFILNDTIQSNIFFMKDKNAINQKVYLEILNISCLEKDLSLMKKGDLSPAGDGGCFLSGGQKKRICIARTLLESEINKLKEQIIFFDEPTYSLDPETLITIWKNCFINFLGNSIRIIATNNLDFIKYGNKIIYVENKEIIFCGNYNEFINNKNIYEKYQKLNSLLKQRSQEIKKELILLDKHNNTFTSSKINDSPKDNTIITKQRTRNETYDKFIRILICGYNHFFLLIFILIIWIILRFFSEYFLFAFKNNDDLNFPIKNLIYLYLIINFSACILLYIRLVLTSKYTISGGKNLHQMMLKPIINTSPKSQQIINSAELINIFSRDLGMVDFFSSVMFGNCLTFGGAFISLLLAILRFFNIFIFLIPIIISFGFFLTNLYLEGFRQLIQLETQMRTHITNFIKEMIFGNEEIQSYNINNKFLLRFNKLYNNYFLCHITAKNSNAWFLYSISLISFILKFIFMFYFYYQIRKGNVYIFQDKIGILFISMFSIHEYFNRFLSHVVTFQNSLMAFNRCLSRTDLKNKNIEINLSPNDNNKSLFLKGLQKEIKFENVCIKYNKTGENVLKNITFKIKKGEKIGICGKTGVGKTTLLMSLLKLVDINEGTIFFEETININNIDFNILRQNIIYITQDINLFDELTIKENIEPYGKYDKNEIKNILKNYSFNELINEKDENSGLNLDKIFDVKLKELNFSFGQKNIICLIRAILRYHENKNSIILIDEMIDKNDFITSDKIMNLLINKFKEGTLLIVTHRIKLLKQCDKILVLENGKIAEFDNPNNLLSDSNSKFYKYNLL